jgi:superoxide dismutase, Fe-Mn family
MPILALDIYEHSYHIDFRAKAATYVDTFMDVIRWTNTGALFHAASKNSGAEA